MFSIAVDEINLTDALARELNEINTKLHFCRTFWVRDQVLFESEHLGDSISGPDFNECVENVASASDFFGPVLSERHGGRQIYEESKAEDYLAPGTGFYL